MKYWKFTDTSIDMTYFLFSEQSAELFIEKMNNPEDFVVEIIEN